MGVNPSKFQGFLIDRNNGFAPTMFNLTDVDIPISDTVKILGVHIDSNLTFDTHITTICKKAARHLKAIRRVSKYLDEPCRKSLYHAFILSHFNYCCIVWHHCDSASAIKVEKIQKRALRVIMNDYESSYQDLLIKSGQPLMFVSRLRSIACEVYKSIHKLNPSFLHDLFTYKHTGYESRRKIKLHQRLVKTQTYGIRSVRYEGAQLWNKLPPEIIKAESFQTFKSLIKKWEGPQCQCGFCSMCRLKLV